MCDRRLAERGAVHLASIVLATQHGEGGGGSAEKDRKAQGESATAQRSGYGLFGTCKDRRAEEKMWQKKEAREENMFVWKAQSMRMTAFDVRLKTGMSKENKKSSHENK